MENHLKPDVASTSHSGVSNVVPQVSPYDYSLIGEHLRLGLLLTAVALLLWLVQLTPQQQLPTVPTIAIAVLLLTLLSARGFAWLRSMLLLAMTINVLALVINPQALAGLNNSSPFKAPNLILLFCLAIASTFELISLARGCSRRTRTKALWWSLLAIPAIVYAIGLPIATSLWESQFADPAQLAKRPPDWTMTREISFRFVKFLVFATFSYLGACLGSFLNVVAWCIPRGKSIAMRDSCCPQCNEKIKRVDNLPIFSYINLSAACRNCKASIPARYLIVELTVALIFGSLFLYQLVTGAVNVPGTKTPTYVGILWIIMYPKWGVIAIYFYHALFMSMLLVMALIEIDRQKLKFQLSSVLIAAFALPAIFSTHLQPVPFAESFSVSSVGHPMLAQLLKIAAGGITGGLIGVCSRLLLPQVRPTLIISAMMLTGIVHGWQSVLHVSVLFALIMLVARFLPGFFGKFLKDQPSTVLLVVVMIHHPFWRLIFDALAV
jgi:leader peptidase (prepilin peptidase)/N-methyltransferase